MVQRQVGPINVRSARGAGAILISCGAALTTTAIPIAVAARDAEERVAAFARNAMARVAGAAAGPLVALVLFDAAGGAVSYSVAGVLLFAIAIGLATGHGGYAVVHRAPYRMIHAPARQTAAPT